MKQKPPSSKAFVGRVIRLTANNITIKLSTGKKQTFSIADDVTVINDGMISSLDELQVGQNIRVTTPSKDFNLVVVIESRRNNAEFPTVTRFTG